MRGIALTSLMTCVFCVLLTSAGAAETPENKSGTPVPDAADSGGADDTQNEAAQAEFFETQIRPLLVEHCYDCHSGDDVEASLWLDSRHGWQTGGDSGAAIVAGDVENSILIDAVRYTENVIPGMPPDSKLSDQQIKLLERWVEMGAFDPREPESDSASAAIKFDLEGRRQSHWSWQPITSPAVPDVNDASWPRDDLDRFIQARLDSAGLVPAADADKLTWLRRVSFDLTGLPPTIDQIHAFENDDSQHAKTTVVDRLIGSMHFGEKWARHWMDLTRYADSYGHEFDYAIDHAYEYRDYLIRAFNADVPYDQLVREHIAGDLMTDPRMNPTESFNESIIGTGFWYLHEATHAPTDVLQNEADIASNQIDVFGKTFLGLTIACARCHDHKFDAISTADYYAMFSHLQSSCRQDYPLDPGQINAGKFQQIDALRDQIADRLSESSESPRRRDRELASAPDWPRFESKSVLLADFRGDRLPTDWQTNGHAFAPIDDSLRYAVSTTDSELVPDTVDSGARGAKAAGTLRSPSFELTDTRIHIRLRSDAHQMVRLVIDNYEMNKVQQLLFAGTILQKKNIDTQGKWRWMTLSGDIKKYIGHRAYLEIVDSGPGSIAVDQIWMSGSDAPADQPTKVVPQIDLAAISSKIQQLKQLAKSLRPPRFVIAIAEGTRREMPIYIRGSHTNQGAKVPPRILEALGGQTGSRLDLADRIASLDNPLTARVMVNRIWHHLLGKGIVASVDDFGPQGIAPTHPELLDHLATEFARDGWSIQNLVRRIVLSRTYGQSSVANPANSADQIANSDPTNALLHRMNIRRLPAESIRDGILVVAGTLDPKPFGPGVPTHRTPFMTGRGARESGPLDGDRRRTVYLTVYRNFLNPFLMTFDMPNPFGPQGRRSRSNVPAQSLAMMNDPFVIEQAEQWVKQSIAADRNFDQHPKRVISDMVLRAHGHHASDAQIEQLWQFVHSQTAARGGDQQAAWQDLAQSLWNMKAYLFLR
ncbi:PSD1 and planctomycete cytochrome C domain-containing protein [Stieleria sp. TO1_6]|uniref:PSD1 and planctomycete cytochrome C domain-containing protein n=1 Tax=Stieleria tagensis TaxID=2956795 RepID=UPI00209AC670|nr:PSD1 and planctomycete cytochrome C domain-containing protein [Stieleria tagensis]MCO8120659.1 PSD1 and planctomycete cytochrome C domain-containing protein [Stieleria tagensis]